MSTPIVDERRGFPSASGLEHIALCPGSWNAERGLPDLGGADAESGTKLHAVLADEEDGADLDGSDAWAVDRCREIEAGLVAQLGFDGGADVFTEVRLWYADDTCEWSGKPDRIYRLDGRALLVDWKTGRGDVAPAESNWQMRGLAVLIDAAHSRSLDEIFVALIQPRSSEPVTLARYERADLTRAEMEIRAALYWASKEDAPRTPGEAQCKYCRAKDRCPEALGQAVALVDVSLPALTGEQFAEYLPQVKAAKKTIDAFLKAAGAFIEGGGVIPGWEMKPGTADRSIVDPQGAYAALADVVTAEEFMAICGVPVGKLEALYEKKSGLRGEALKVKLAERLGAAIGMKQKAASLARAKM